MHAMHALSQLSYGPERDDIPSATSRFCPAISLAGWSGHPCASIFNLFIIFCSPNLESPSILAACV
jgi:hypothetical protein